MINELVNTLTSGGAAESVTVTSAIVTMLISIILGLIISFTYIKTCEKQHSQSFAVTLTMLPVILAVIILFVGSNVARAFSLAGTLSIIRFRSAPGDPKDIGYIFFAIAAGLSCGVGMYLYGGLFVLVLCIFMYILSLLNFGHPKDFQKLLKITIPEDLDFDHAFDEVLSKYTKKYSMMRVRTTNLGSLYEVSYNVVLDKNCNEKEFVDKLRCLNGNLTIQMSVPIAEQL